ncbi:fungal-specific transcription factor domain-containing protein [Colletotrichum phormii]|uniref:Fungal-specific transcription factor domain-containing protein n=1 Tax=Colletotrichum phormii TaxID=359342 RepID=A0AAJ0E7V8_9PEZI|nr:fungal-specific transcription factor domain-containing protein [Colletotrichum phormii]KAK1621991.1 fungal-specific transcription factor domain-containing protein [Colletotrichum phormii]
MPRETASCWTCRIRHKKCDESFPACNVCAARDSKQAMTDKLKAEVTKSAKLRGARRVVQRIVGDAHANDLLPPVSTTSGSTGVTTRYSLRQNPLATVTQSQISLSSDFQSRSLPHPNDGTPNPGPQESATSPGKSTPQLSTELEQCYISAYLDYIFPTLFPFYSPSILEGGRSWMLFLTLANKSLSHAATSLASHFLAVVPVQRRHSERPKYTHIAMQKAQQDVKEVIGRGVLEDLITSIRLYDSIVHLLYLEVTFGTSENWTMHLGAGIKLLEQILHEVDGEEFQDSKWTATCRKVGRLAYPHMENPPQFPAWTLDQSSFRFFTALLVVHDLVASTSLGKPPRLQTYYQDMLVAEDKPEEISNRDCSLRLDRFIGCQKWAMILIAEVASLDSWKKNVRERGSFSNLELFRRGGEIEMKFREGLGRLSAKDPMVRDKRPPWLADSRLAEEESKAIVSVTQVWAHAGLIYLHVVLSGWHPDSMEISDSVTQNLESMMKLSNPRWLHTLAWPICVNACLAKEEQEGLVGEIFDCRLANFGAVRLAREVFEAAWLRRHNAIIESWDLEACLNVLGRRVLLG